jgi:predicted extracellular nuclease
MGDPVRIPTFQRRTVGVAALVGAALVASPLVAAPAYADPAGTGLVISEVYGGGGNSGAAFNQDFIELYNPGDADVALAGMSLQYRSAAATTAVGSSNITSLSGIVAPGEHFLVGAAFGSNTALPALPTVDLTGTLALGGTTGQVILVNGTAPLAAFGPGSITSDSDLIVDLIGYGATTFEGAAGPAATNATSVTRDATGTDTDNNAADFVSGVPTPEACGEACAPPPPADPIPATIAEIQGSGATSPLVDVVVTTTGVVTAAYPTGGFNGYYIQTPGTGGAIASGDTTSDAVYVFSSATVDDVALGDTVEVTGTVSEYQGLTEITPTSADSVEILPDAAQSVAPITSEIPVAAAAREALEGMLVLPKSAFTVTDNYDTNYYAEISLNPGAEPLKTPTAVVEPGQPAIDYAAANAARIIALDDGASTNFNSAANKGVPIPYLSNTNPVRIGAAVTFTKPVILDYRNNIWKFQPTTQLTVDNAATVQPATFENTRAAKPQDVGGDLTFASFNVLNYFPTTGDQLVGCTFYTDRAGNPITVNTGCNARGAANAENLGRQQAKIVAAINGLDADVVSLEEIENSVRLGNNRDFAVSTLVDALNAALGSAQWAYVASPLSTPASQDVIRTAFIYKKAVAKPVGSSKILDDPAFVNARQPLAQKFERVGGTDADSFLAIVNHFKSKSPSDTVPDPGDGAGAFNADRVAQARALVSFAETMKETTDTKRVLLSGDFNAYLKEDPIDVITAAGYVDLGSAKTNKSTYAFDGAVGSLDHIFISDESLDDVSGVDIWNINAYESIALEYSRYNYNATNFYVADPYRSSDHDPIIVGLDLSTSIEAGNVKIAGDGKIGATLKAKTGKWLPDSTKFDYQWLKNGDEITGATKKAYTVKKSDRKGRISVTVTGTKSGYKSVSATSDSVKIKRSLKATPKPKIVGSEKVGRTLKTKTGDWKPGKVSFDYQWMRGSKEIAGADNKAYSLKKADKGKKITVVVTGSKKGYFPESEKRSTGRIR